MPEQAEETNPEKSKKIKGGNLIICMLSIIPIVTMLAFFLVTKVVNPRFASPVAAEVTESRKDDRKEFCTYELGSVVANPSGIENLRIMKVGVSLELESESLIEDMEKSKPRLQHQLIMTLSSKDIGTICSLEGKAALLKELKDAFTKELDMEQGKIREIYFSEFVIQ